MVGLDRFRVVVEAGRGQETGVVVRLPGVLIVARVGRPRTADTARRLLDLCAEVAAEPGDTASTGRRLVRRVAGLLAAADPEDVPDFALLTAIGERIAALVHGAMDVAAGGSSPITLSGVESATWVDRLLPDGITHLHIAPSDLSDGAGQPGGEGAEVTGTGLGFPLDLRVGAVPGVGASLLPARDAPLPTPRSAAGDLLSNYGSPREPATAAERIPLPADRIPEQQSVAPPPLAPLLTKEEQAHRAQSGSEPTQAADFDELEFDEYDEDPPTELARPLGGAANHDEARAHGELTEDDDSEALTQLPGQTFTVSDLIEDDDAPTMLPDNGQAQVEGVLCPNGHFNHPQAPYCADCGASLSAQEGQSVWRPRPSIGVLVFDDGQTIPLDIDLVIGRQPDRDDAVRAGKARPLAVEDGESAVSRVHAVITLSGWDAVITDRGSANGTYIAPPEATVWTPLEPNQPAPLVSGTRVQVGKRTFVFNGQVNV
jgi:hypothetical protein